MERKTVVACPYASPSLNQGSENLVVRGLHHIPQMGLIGPFYSCESAFLMKMFSKNSRFLASFGNQDGLTHWIRTAAVSRVAG